MRINILDKNINMMYIYRGLSIFVPNTKKKGVVNG